MPASSIPAAFAAAALAAPGSTSLRGESRTLSYSQLAAESDAIAGMLRARGVGRGATVGLYSNRCAEAVTAILGILKTGAAYVPFDSSYPLKLLQYIYQDSAPSAMLVQEQLIQPDGTEPFWEGECLKLGQPMPAHAAMDCDWAQIAASDPAYIMYTSGSTGRPKGVVVPHGAVLRLVLDNDFAHVGPDEVVLQLAPLSFDASTFELWSALLNGGTLAVVSNPYPSLEDISAAIAQYRVTTLWLTAGLFHLMVDNQLAGLRPLRQLLAGGDVLSPPHVVKALRGLPHCRLINGYGPTENTTFSCCYSIPHDYTGDGPVPIGRPIRQTEALILDEDRRAVAPGTDGELYVGGAGLALQYLNRPELTAERFIAHPLSREAGARLYRTGDRVRQRADGNLEFLGRVDRQVKINGKRVELDEIEARLRATGMVQDAAVVCSPLGTGPRQISAFVTTPGNAPLALDPLRAALREELPDYMIPLCITQLDALPLSPTGKVDRGRLPTVAPRVPESSGRAPTDTTEAALIEIVRRVLGKETVGVEDNFFDLGATSLQILEVHASVRRSLPCEISVVDLFRYPRISALAARMSGTAAPVSATFGAQERARRQQAALARRRPNTPHKSAP
ncbi:MAG TPA: non-ribosomal peptide synthetase [Steroidobacteraceae bacterium]|nr:non-ribosomal peptide synthetase [Steroidobacteraceae bacterium]